MRLSEAADHAGRVEVRELRIEIDEALQTHKVAANTTTDYFKDMRARASELRRTVGS